MEIPGISEMRDLVGLPRHQYLTIGVAIKRNKKSKYIIKWAVEKFASEGEVMFKLIHVRPKITTVPTAMGNSIPISQVRNDVATAYKKEVEWQTNEKLLPYKRMFTRNKLQAEILQIESDDVISAISNEVAKAKIGKLVIAASSHGMFSRRQNISAKISESTPSFCTVYVISNGKLSSLRPSDIETNASIRDDSSVSSFSTNDSSNCSLNSQADFTPHPRSPSLPMQRFHALSNINQGLLHNKTLSIESNDYGLSSLDTPERINIMSSTISSCPSNSGESSATSLFTENRSWVSNQASKSDGSDFSSPSSDHINFELEKIRIELRHVKGMYAMAQSEATDASEKLNDLYKRRSEEANKLKEIQNMGTKAKQLAIEEKQRYEAVKREAECMKYYIEREAAQRRDAEMIALYESKEKERLERALVGPLKLYREFEWEEIVAATSSFSEELKIGMGAYGSVYKCSLHHTTVAVKVLHCKEAQGNKQFQQELEILSKIRHPHLLILLGACPEQGCLVYEYMENGSLEDKLVRKNNTPPIPWFDRFRIAWEIASALVFLHNSDPQPIIHRDLKPANILLDRNYVSKIGDVGLSKMIYNDSVSITSLLNDTALVGTLCYIDPEYQRSGVVSVFSDVYAFGMVILQLLTGKVAMSLVHMVEVAIENGCIEKILDLEAGCWPIEETKELAELGLKCAELRRRDRPDLREKVLPVLERLKEIANKAKDVALDAEPAPPNHFICPILKEIMEDPCVAADGYSYDRRAIEKWFKEKDKSPMTNLPLPNKNLIPNNTLISAISQWKCGK